jgi:hypothetical protein
MIPQLLISHAQLVGVISGREIMAPGDLQDQLSLPIARGRTDRLNLYKACMAAPKGERATIKKTLSPPRSA